MLKRLEHSHHLFFRRVTRFFAACAAVLLSALWLHSAQALPIFVDKLQGSMPLKDVASYLYSSKPALDVNAASSPGQQNAYQRLADGIPVNASGVFWLRFSILDDTDENAGTPLRNITTVLQLGYDAPPASAYIADEVGPDGTVTRWTRFPQQPDGSFRLTLKNRKIPATVYVRMESVPGLNFAPVLMSSSAADNTFGLPLTPAANTLLLLGLVIGLVRLARQKDTWRIWSCLLTVILLLASFMGSKGFEPPVFELATLICVLAPGIAIMLYPHIGRALLHSEGSPALNNLLTVLSIPGAIIALLALVPTLGWTFKFMPFAPLVLLPLLLAGFSRAKSGYPGATTYTLACLFPFVGAVLYGVGIIMDIPALGQGLPMLGYGLASIILAVARPAVAEETAADDAFPLNNLFHDNAELFDGGSPNGLLSGMSGGLSSLLNSKGQEPAPSSQLEAPDTSDDGAMRKGQPEAAAKPRNIPFETPRSDFAGLSPFPADMPTARQGKKTTGFMTAETPDPAAESAAPSQPEHAGLAWNFAMMPDPQRMAADTKTQLPAASPHESPKTEAPRQIATAEPVPADVSDGDTVMAVKDSEEPGLIILKHVVEDDEPLGYEADPRNAVLRQAEQDHILRGAEQERDAAADYRALARVESALRATYDNIVQTLDKLKQSRADSQNILDGVENSLGGLGSVLNNMDKIASGELNSPQEKKSAFNLMRLVRSVHAQNLETAETKGVTLSWFVAPSLPNFFIGHAEALHSALSYLLQGTLETADTGSVQLSVRPSEDDAESVRFTLLDSSLSPESARAERMNRPTSWISKAWELSGMADGSFCVEFIPGRGTAISFTIRLQAADDEGNALKTTSEAARNFAVPGGLALEQSSGGMIGRIADKSVGKSHHGDCIVVADMSSSGRKQLIRLLEGLPYIMSEARVTDDIVKAATKHDLGLVIVDAEFPEMDIKSALQEVQTRRSATALPAVPILGMLSYEEQRPRMEALGCNACLLKTCSPDTFRSTVLQLAPDDEAVQVDTAVPAASSQERQGPVKSAQSPFGAASAAPVTLADMNKAEYAVSANTAGGQVQPEAPMPAAAENVMNPSYFTAEESLIPHAQPHESQAEHWFRPDDFSEDAADASLTANNADPNRPSLELIRPDDEQPGSLNGQGETTAGAMFRTDAEPIVAVSATVSSAVAETQTGVSRISVMPEKSVAPNVASASSRSEQADGTEKHSAAVTSTVKVAGTPVSSTGGVRPQTAHLAQAPVTVGVEEGTSSRKNHTVLHAAQPTPPSRPNQGFSFAAAPTVQVTGNAKSERVSEDLMAQSGTPDRNAEPKKEASHTSIQKKGDEPAPAASTPTGQATNVLGLSIKGFDPVALAMPDAIGVPGPKDTTASRRGATAPANGASATDAPEPQPENASTLAPLSGLENEYVDASLLPLLPGFVLVLDDSLKDIEKGIQDGDCLTVSGAASRISGQSSTFGLTNLERMASCVERAAQAEDLEAVRDLSGELANMTTKYRDALKETHKQYMRKAALGTSL